MVFKQVIGLFAKCADLALLGAAVDRQTHKHSNLKTQLTKRSVEEKCTLRAQQKEDIFVHIFSNCHYAEFPVNIGILKTERGQCW